MVRAENESGQPAKVGQHEVMVPGWRGALVMIVAADGRVYIPLRMLCEVLGIDARQQLDRLREHAVLAQMLSQQYIQTRGGRQAVWCIERRGLGFWLGGVQLNKLRSELRDSILALQWAIVDAADRVLFGEVAPDPLPAQLATPVGPISGL